jgi:hypothetical protein
MEKTKKCSGCKNEKELKYFYKNKLVLDGHSNYCVICTKENSRKYFQRKKEKSKKIESDNLLKIELLQNYSPDIENVNVDRLVRVLMVEKLCKSILVELDTLKETFIEL